MESYDKVYDVMDYINKQGGRSQARVDELKSTGKLDEIYNKFGIDNIIKNEIETFVNILFNKNLDKYPLTKRTYLYNCDILRIFNIFGYEIGALFNDSDSYHRLPRFIKNCSLHFGIYYDYNEFDKLIYYYLDIDNNYDPNRKRDEQDITAKFKQAYTNYDDYLKLIYSGNYDLNDRNTLYIFSELLSVINEETLLHNTCYQSIWVAKDFGDGYGFDVISYDLDYEREKAIEVKSGKRDFFTLTKNEYQVLNRLKDYNTIDYYVYHYYLNNSINKYIYDYDNNIFRDINDNSIVELYETKVSNEESQKEEVAYRSRKITY